MKVRLSKTAQKEYKKLPDEIKDKANNKFLLLDINLHHPQLFTKKITGLKRWESRINYQYRFTFIIEENTILILSIGPHDEGLGKK